VNVVITHLHLDYPGGSEAYTYTLVRALVAQVHHVTVLSPIHGLVVEHLLGVGVKTHAGVSASRSTCSASTGRYGPSRKRSIGPTPCSRWAGVPRERWPAGGLRVRQTWGGRLGDGRRHGKPNVLWQAVCRRLSANELADDLTRYPSAMGRGNKAIAEERYDIDRHVPRLLEVYREAATLFVPRGRQLPVHEAEVALPALGARLVEPAARIPEGPGQR
jgi:hypothetical protein